MNNIYFFSLNNLRIKCGKDEFLLGKNRAIKIDNPQEIIKVYSSHMVVNSLDINLSKAESNNHIRVNELSGDKFVEIIAINNDNIINKHSTLNAEVYIYDNYVDICFSTKFYTYYYNGLVDSRVMEKDKKLYIFNMSNLLIFDMQKKSFNLLKCKKMAKNDNIYELLCNIPYNNVYFLLFSFNFKNNLITIKTYKKDILNYDNYSLPYVFFGMCKAGILKAKNLIDEKINYDNLLNYFNDFDNMIEINNKIYLCGKNLSEFNCKIENNKIIDVD